MTADLAGACMAHFTNIEEDTASIITEPSQKNKAKQSIESSQVL